MKKATKKNTIWQPQEIVEMCRKAGFIDGMAEIIGIWGLHEFARIVAEKERERIFEIVKEGLWDGAGIQHYLKKGNKND